MLNTTIDISYMKAEGSRIAYAASERENGQVLMHSMLRSVLSVVL